MVPACFVLKYKRYHIIITDMNCTPKKMMEDNDFEFYSVLMIINKNEFDVYKTVEALKNSINSLSVAVKFIGFVLEEENYKKCKEVFDSSPEIGLSEIKEFGVEKELRFHLSPETDFSTLLDNY